MVGKEVWWISNKEGDVEFFNAETTADADSRANGPKLHHFCSSNFKEE